MNIDYAGDRTELEEGDEVEVTLQGTIVEVGSNFIDIETFEGHEYTIRSDGWVKQQ